MGVVGLLRQSDAFGEDCTRFVQAAASDQGVALVEVRGVVGWVQFDHTVELANRVYDELRAAGIDAGLDDRKMSPGAKFKDLDLLGFPLTVVAGRRADEGVVELGVRRDGVKEEIPASESVERCRSAIAALTAPS